MPLGTRVLTAHGGQSSTWTFSFDPSLCLTCGVTGTLDTVAKSYTISGTVKGVMPVAAVDGEPVGETRPGEVTRRVMDLYADALARN